ncbi:transposase, partial [Paeniroseomonas aquatica]
VEPSLTTEPSCKDEARVGQKGRMVRRWFQRGMRPRMVKDQRYRSAYIFGAVCPARDTGAALVLPHVSVAAMNLLLTEVSGLLPERTHAVMLIDNADWHTANELQVPSNISLVHLPPYAPELNAIEKVWQYLRDRYGSSPTLAPSSMPGTDCWPKPAALHRSPILIGQDRSEVRPVGLIGGVPAILQIGFDSIPIFNLK